MRRRGPETPGVPDYSEYIFSADGNFNQEVERIYRQAGFFNLGTKAFLEELNLDLAEKTILIPGIGPGAGLSIWQDFNVGKIVGLDMDERMLSVAETKAKELGMRASFVVGNVLQLDNFMESNSVDGVASRLLMTHIPKERLSGVMDRFKDVLRPNGIAIFEEPMFKGWRFSCEAFGPLQDAFRSLLERTGLDPDIGESITDQCKQAGLQIKENKVRLDQNPPELKLIHYFLFAALEKPITQMRIMSPEEFGQRMQEFREHLLKPETVAYGPPMRQLLAVTS